MTMKLIRFGTKRAGFADWPRYDNIPGKKEPHIATIAYQDPCWEDRPPPRTYNTQKTLTGEKIAAKIRDLRLRRALTGKTSLPRLTRKTSPKQVEAEQVDFEEEVARYKRDIEKDIQMLKGQAYKAPAWVTKIIDKEESMQCNKLQSSSSSSSRWEEPISDTQAVAISDFLMTAEEEKAFFQEDGEDTGLEREAVPTTAQSHEVAQDGSDAIAEHHEASTTEVEHHDAPSWEHLWEADAQPAETTTTDSFDWEAWLEDIKPMPRPGYKPFDDLLKSPHYQRSLH